MDLLPEDAVKELAAVHNALGIFYGQAGRCRHRSWTFSKGDPLYGTARGSLRCGATRGNVALALAQFWPVCCALVYAQAALRDFEHFGAVAAVDIDRAQQLIADIKQDLAATEAS